MRLRSVVVIALGLAWWLGSAPIAHAYTINTTELGKRIRWGTDVVALRLEPAFEEFLRNDEATAAMEMALDAWRGLPRVPDLVLQNERPSAKPGHRGAAPSNGVYLVERWPYEPDKLAITVITYEMETGRLLDADILVNGEIRFGLLDERGKRDTKRYDLAAVLTHEVGHVLGLGESEDADDATMWPYAAPGETSKRTLADDDEEGVIESYLSAPPLPVGGCGAMTVAGRAHPQPWLGMAAMLLSGMALRTRRRKRIVFGMLALANALLLVGFDTPPRAAVSAHADRLHAAHGPRASIDAGSTEGRSRLQAFQGTASSIVRGRAKRIATHVDDAGLYFTDFAVHGSDGRKTTLRVLGGVRGGIGQRALHGTLPRDDQDIAVATQPDGSQRWAFTDGERLFGGYLGDGPAIVSRL